MKSMINKYFFHNDGILNTSKLDPANFNVIDPSCTKMSFSSGTIVSESLIVLNDCKSLLCNEINLPVFDLPYLAI
jgi:hypothetical protein